MPRLSISILFVFLYSVLAITSTEAKPYSKDTISCKGRLDFRMKEKKRTYKFYCKEKCVAKVSKRRWRRKLMRLNIINFKIEAISLRVSEYMPKHNFPKGQVPQGELMMVSGLSTNQNFGYLIIYNTKTKKIIRADKQMDSKGSHDYRR